MIKLLVDMLVHSATSNHTPSAVKNMIYDNQCISGTVNNIDGNAMQLNSSNKQEKSKSKVSRDTMFNYTSMLGKGF